MGQASVLWLPATVVRKPPFRFPIRWKRFDLQTKRLLTLAVLWCWWQGEPRTARALAMLARERLLPQGLLARLRRWWVGGVGCTHPPQTQSIACDCENSWKHKRERDWPDQTQTEPAENGQDTKADRGERVCLWTGAHPPLSAVVHSGDGASPTAVGESSRDLAAAALYDAGLLRSPGEDEDKAKATGVLLVSAAAMAIDATTTAVRQPRHNAPLTSWTFLHT